jgi:hypothetical protein
MQAVASDTTWVHCSIHQEALAAKGMPDSLKDVLDTTVKMQGPWTLVYFLHYAMIMAATMYHFYNIQKCTGYQGAKYLTRFFKLRDKLKDFFTDHNFHLSDRLHDDEFLTWLAYLGDVFSPLNDLNLGLQAFSATIFNMRDKIEDMIKKLALFSVCI